MAPVIFACPREASSRLPAPCPPAGARARPDDERLSLMNNLRGNFYLLFTGPRRATGGARHFSPAPRRGDAFLNGPRARLNITARRRKVLRFLPVYAGGDGPVPRFIALQPRVIRRATVKIGVVIIAAINASRREGVGHSHPSNLELSAPRDPRARAFDKTGNDGVRTSEARFLTRVRATQVPI